MAKKKLTNDPVEAGIRSVKEFYDLGRRSTERQPGRMEYGAMDTEAERFGTSREHLRTARQFFDGPRAYTKRQLKQLEQDCRRHGCVIGPTHIVRLLTVPQPQRAALQRDMIGARWSMSRLRAELKRRFGTRMRAGRRRRISNDPKAVMWQAHDSCVTLRRWHDQLVRTPPGKQTKPMFEKLPPDVQRKLSATLDHVFELQAVLERKLPNALPKPGGTAKKKRAAKK